MGDVGRAIERYIRENIKLNLTDISQSATSREWLLDRIKNKIALRASNGKKEPVLHPYQPFVYFGSYFKKTKVQVVDEYDVLVVIDSNGGMFSVGGSKIGDGQGSVYPNYKYEGGKYLKSDDSGISPSKMLNWLKGVVSEVVTAFGGEAPERDGQAITATIKSSNIKIDLVPAGSFTNVATGKTFYNIPAANRSDDWVLTAPEDDMKALEIVAKNKDNFRNVVRLCKRIKETYNFQVCSFAIETAIVQYGTTAYWTNNLYLDFHWALKSLVQKFKNGSISDPFNGKNLIAGVESLSWYADRIDRILEVLDNCTRNDDQNRAYQKVWGAFENKL